MKYRKYKNMQIQLFTITLAAAFFFTGCASMQQSPGGQFVCEDCLIIKEDLEAKVGEESRSLAAAATDVMDREPASMVGNFAWLNSVQSDFDRIASETSQRSLANAEPSVLVERKRWSFRFFPDQNRFGLVLDGSSYSMVQTKFEDNGLYAFAAADQSADPITLSVSQKLGEFAAGGETAGNCVFELSYWDKRERSYSRDIASVRGNRCAEIINQLRSFVP